MWVNNFQFNDKIIYVGNMVDSKLKEAIHDLRYLLNQGYPRDSAVEFVSDHHLLKIDDRHLLTRCIFSKKEITDHSRRKINFDEACDKEIGIDGYNVLITVESILRGDRVIKCDDGFIRDLQAIFGKYSITDATNNALLEILEKFREIKPQKIFFFFDEQVSKSGELAGFVRRELDKIGIDGDAQTAKGTDAKVWDHEISASSDRVIIERSERILDIPEAILEDREANLMDLTGV